MRLWLAALCVACACAVSAAQPTRTFGEPQYGLFFNYPSSWTLNPVSHLQPAPMVLSLLEPEAKPLVRVGNGEFNPLPHSTFEGLEFTVVVLEGGSAKSCRDRLLTLDVEKPSSTVVDGVTYTRATGLRDTNLHAVESTVYAAFRNRRCFLFEEDIHDARAVPDDGVHMMRPQESALISRQLEAVMTSVHFNPGLAR